MHVGFIGAGNMAHALARAIVTARPRTTVVASDPDGARLEHFSTEFDSFVSAEANVDVADRADVTFIAVKPQALDSVLSDLESADGLFVSIVAGARLCSLEARMPAARIIRVMPNTPCLVGEMAAGYSLGSSATPDDSSLVRDLLSSAGVAVLLDEELLDAVTGLSGSGPAFVARLIGAFVDAGVAVGLPEDVARALTLATFSGTARLLAERDLSEEDLVAMVSSPGGTTIAGRRVLEASAYRDVIRRTVTTATERSRELGE